MKKPTLFDFLRIALAPVGRTMYIWGGGWNERDDGAGIDAVTLGISPRWVQFAAQQSTDYDAQQTRFQIHDGLDCSGYVGWAVYNTVTRVSGGCGYVMPAAQMTQHFAQRGWGIYTPANNVTCHLPGDIMSANGHVYIIIGECRDGSVLLVHASPPGVQVSGTVTPAGSKNSHAVHLATQYMRQNHPHWYARFPENVRPTAYLTDYSRLSWNRQTLPDPHRLTQKSAAEVLTALNVAGK